MIGWYVHHHGRGHATRAAAVTRHLAEPVTVLSSLARPPATPPSDWVELPLDSVTGDPVDPTASGRLHWVPIGSPGLQRRMARIAQWIERNSPRLLVVDVSVEVTLLARLCGVPVVVLAGPGDRDDAPHQLAYDVADHIVAAWPQDVYDPPYLHRHRHKTSYVGAFSRFDKAIPLPAGADVLVLNGAGGSAVTAGDLTRAQAADPDRRWTAVGGAGRPWVADVWAQLSSASVVVSHGGQNALAEVAAARRPTVVVPQRRPFDEQVRVADAIGAHGLAVTVPAWPDAAEWPAILDRALELGGSGWSRWSSGDGAERAAEVIAA